MNQFNLPAYLAQSTGPGFRILNPALSSNLQNTNGVQFFAKLLPALINLAFAIGAMVFVFMLILGGIQWITAGGDKAALESAKGRVMNALIGVLILFSLYAILNLVGLFFGINFTQINIGALKIG